MMLLEAVKGAKIWLISEWFLVAQILGAVVVLLAVYTYLSAQKVLQDYEHTKVLLKSERKGRINSERKLRDLIKGQSFGANNASASHAGGDMSDSTHNSGGSNEVVPTAGRLRPIGFVKSPFTRRNGTPRQGGLVESARSLIELESRVEPNNSLLGLEQYSHIWLLWEFHENTNAASSSIKSKVEPPRARGERVGLYATRTPHRHNPIGLSLVRLDRISANRKAIWVLGGDLLNGTPILDIKPYVPAFESIPVARVPEWVGTRIEDTCEVEWSQQASTDLRNAVNSGKLQFYGVKSVWGKDLLAQRKQIATITTTTTTKPTNAPTSQTSLASSSSSSECTAILDDEEELLDLKKTITAICQRQDVRSQHQRVRVQASSYSFNYDRLLVHISFKSSSPTMPEASDRISGRADFKQVPEEESHEDKSLSIFKRRDHSVPRISPQSESQSESESKLQDSDNYESSHSQSKSTKMTMMTNDNLPHVLIDRIELLKPAFSNTTS